MESRPVGNIETTNITAILEVARRLGLSYDLDDLLDRIVRETIAVLACERATLFLYDPILNELCSKIATGVDQIRIPADRGIAGACAQTRKLINIPDAYADARFNPDVDRRTGYHTRNILSGPLVGLENRLVGVLQAVNKRSGPFSPTDEWLLETLGSQAAVAIQRAHLLKELEEKHRLENELNLAREIQQNLLPKELPAVPGYDIAGWNRPADQTGGDCYDFLISDDGEPGILLADASGHGIAPALVMTELRALLRSLFGLKIPLPEMMTRINNILCQDLPSDRFVTAFCGVLSPARHELHYASAGQGPLLHIRPAAGTIESFGANACPLGIIADMPFPLADPIRLAPGDLFLVITDGFFEWANKDGELFGIDRLQEFALRHADLSARDFIAAILDAVERFAPATTQKDDLTAVVVKRNR